MKIRARADERHVKLSHRLGRSGLDRKTFVVDAGEISDSGRAQGDLPLEPTGVILVPKEAIHF